MNNSSYAEQLRLHGSLVYTNVGDSMMPLLRQNRDLLIVEKRPEGRCKKYDVVLYQRPAGEYVLHRILKICKDGYVICGDNRWQREFGVPDEWILGVLTAVVRDGKQIDVTDPAYRRYVRLWCDFFWIRAGILWIRDLPGRLRRKLRKHEAKKQR